jgi:hypothetical protein
MSDESIEAFARELAAEVEEAARAGHDSVYSEEEFTRLILDQLGDEGTLENPIPLWQEGTFGRTKYKITGYSLSDDEDRLLLTNTIYTGELPPRVVTRDEILNAFQYALKFYECSRNGLHEKIDPSKTEVSDLARRIFELHKQLGVLRLVLLSDGLTGLKSIDLKEAFDGTRIIVDLFGIEQLHRILGKGLTRDDIFVNFQQEHGSALSCLKISAANDYDAFLAAIPGRILADIYEKFGNRLLELNVRAFLGVRGRKSVNAGLRHTIQHEPSRFMAYNNGIVATVDELDLETDNKGALAIRSVRGLQIVNGGQTTASLHRTKKQDGAKLDGIIVSAKIIKANEQVLDNMVVAVSRSANSQNTVQPADFSANDPFHVTVEELANNTWLADGKSRWFYERARGSYGAAELKASFKAADRRRFTSETPKARRFSKTDLAKYLNAWDGFPHLVCFGNQKNFQYLMQRLKDEHPGNFLPDAGWYKNFIAKAILFRTVQSIVKERKFPAYQANISAYTVALLAWSCGDEIDYNLIWSTQSISTELKEMVGKWIGEVDRALRQTAGARMPSEWAKKVECWTALRQIDLEVPNPVPPELGTKRRGSSEAESSGPTAGRTRNLDDAACSIRQLFNGQELRDRDELMADLAAQLGYDCTDNVVMEELNSVLRIAVRRGILEDRGAGFTVFGRNISDYERSFLKEQFVACLQGHSWTDREDSIRKFARWLGFRRTGPAIDEAARSVINGLIREDKLESNGSRIRRRA